MIRNIFFLLMLLFVDSGVNLKMLKEKPNQQFQSEEQLADHPTRRDLVALPAVSKTTNLLPIPPLVNVVNTLIDFGVEIIEGLIPPPPPGAICPCNQTNQTMTKREIKDDDDDVQFRIIGGSPTNLDDYPQMGQLRCDVFVLGFACGCTIVNQYYALTAAHCVLGKSANVTQCNVTVGKHYSVGANRSEPNEKTVSVQKIIAHNAFLIGYYQYDIAILKFNESIQYNQNVKPTCLPRNNATFASRLLIAVGWGVTEPNGTTLSVEKRAVDLIGVSTEQCGNDYKSTTPPTLISDKQICAGDREGKKASCSGDSGGPLFFNSTSPPTQVGIVSLGVDGCASKDYPGVYTNTSAFFAFILKYTTVESGCQIYSNDMPPY